MPLASPTLTASYSTGSNSQSGDGRRHMRRKDFQYKYGQKHHSYDKEKAPYPLSYDRDVLELEGLDNKMAQHLRGTISFAPFKEKHPMRVLDLGCGTGNWIIDAAKAWPDCEFVGFDLADVQIPHHLLPPSIAARIEWKHGNFVTNKLPFPEDEFDHVHIQSIATGVPENKWDTLFSEIGRVLVHGGSIEVIEDDIIFPALPRWFTQALRPRPLRSASTHNAKGGRHPRLPTITSATSSTEILVEAPTHDHALLESLYKSIYENRFINMKPLSVLPVYLTTYFRQVALGPIISFPMPPLPPIQPLPPQVMTSYAIPDPTSDLLLSPRPSTIVPSNRNRAHSVSFSSAVSTFTNSSDSKFSFGSPRSRTGSVPFSYNDTSMTSVDLSAKDDAPQYVDITILPLQRRYMVDNSGTEDNTCLTPGSLFPIEQVNKLNDRSLAMHLYRAYQVVLACREAMWEELKDRIRNRKHELLLFGWDDDEELEELVSRKKFEKLIERYQKDMEARVSFWYSLDAMGWPIPAKEPLSKAELIEATRLRDSMIEARKQATFEEMQIPCRSVRAIVGYNL